MWRWRRKHHHNSVLVNMPGPGGVDDIVVGSCGASDEVAQCHGMWGSPWPHVTAGRLVGPSHPESRHTPTNEAPRISTSSQSNIARADMLMSRARREANRSVIRMRWRALAQLSRCQTEFVGSAYFFILFRTLSVILFCLFKSIV